MITGWVQNRPDLAGLRAELVIMAGLGLGLGLGLGRAGWGGAGRGGAMSRRAEPLPRPRPDDASYYGRPILKPPAWDWRIPAYLFSGGASAGSTLLSVGADLTGRPRLRRSARLAAVAALGASTYFLVSDLGRPERFHHMLRVAKPTSPMSMGTWILAGYSPGIGLAAVGELLPARWGVTRLCGGWRGPLR